MNIPLCIRGALILYILGSLGYMLFAAFRRTWLRGAASSAAWTAFIIHSAVIAHRIWLTHRAPFANMYETLLFFSWLLVIISVVVERVYRVEAIGAFTLPVVVLFLAGTSLLSSDMGPLMPSLKSNWLVVHVSTCFLSYTAFAVAFASSILFLIYRAKDRGPVGGERLELLDSLTYRMITLGFPFLTIGIVTGSVWADLCWGTYWSWDPKETWSLVTWLIYGVFLHLRHTGDLRGVWAAIASVSGFVSVVVTYFGVNYFFSTLHAYA